MEKLFGYRGEIRGLLERIKAEIGDIVQIKKKGITYEGILMPRIEKGNYVTIKLPSGYCIGIQITPDVKIERIKKGKAPRFVTPPLPKPKLELPRVAIISTGGTIAARVEYRTGAVHPALTASDLYAVVPELSNIALIDAEILFSLFSENILPKHWEKIAKTVASHVEKGVEGVVIAHGTDTIAYSTSALSFALQNLPVPVIFVGSQRSSDRPSSDAALNLISATIAASKAPFSEVCLAMHGSISDKAVYIHRGTRVRKCHTSRRDTFRSIGIKPIAKIEDSEITMLTNDYVPRDPKRKLNLKPNFEEKIVLIKFYPGFNPKTIEWYVKEGYYGFILEGTGLGHVGNYCFKAVKEAIKEGLFVGMTSQCIWGRVNMRVYDTGRDLLEAGVIPLEDMLPETALVKLMWAFGQTKDLEKVKKLMLSNIAKEMLLRRIGR